MYLIWFWIINQIINDYHSTCGQSHCRIKSPQRNMNKVSSSSLMLSKFHFAIHCPRLNEKKKKKGFMLRNIMSMIQCQHPPPFINFFALCQASFSKSVFGFVIGIRHLLCFQDITSECKLRRKQTIHAQALIAFSPQYPCLHLFSMHSLIFQHLLKRWNLIISDFQ